MARSAAICSVLLVGLVQAAWAQAPAAPAENTTPAASASEASYTIPAGTKLLLSLKHEVSTRVAKPGDAVYFVTEFPVVQNGVVVIPPGIYVKGLVDKVERPGKVKGRAQLQLHMASMIFPNGVEITIPGAVDSASNGNGATVKNSEGQMQGEGTKLKDADRIATDTVTGAVGGSLVGYGAGNMGMGGAIGGAAGATAGILTTLMTRGSDIVFPAGATMEMVLGRPLVVQQAQLGGMPQFTGVPSTPAPSATPAAGPSGSTAPQAAIAHK